MAGQRSRGYVPLSAQARLHDPQPSMAAAVGVDCTRAPARQTKLARPDYTSYSRYVRSVAWHFLSLEWLDLAPLPPQGNPIDSPLLSILHCVEWQ